MMKKYFDRREKAVSETEIFSFRLKSFLIFFNRKKAKARYNPLRRIAVEITLGGSRIINTREFGILIIFPNDIQFD